MNILQTFLFVSGVLLLFVAISSVESTVTLHDLPEPSFDDLDALFTYFKTKYHRDYDGEEHSLRLVYFQESVERIARLKQDNPLAEFGLTEMADYSPDERRRRTGYRSSTSAMSSQVLVSDPPSLVAGIHTLADVPQSVDWRQSGAVNPIRDQMQCGSCWAFAIVAVTEAQWYLKHKEMLQLSEQMLVSCDPRAYGCDGAFATEAVNGIIQTFGGNVSLRSTYPYVSHLGYAPPCDSSFISTGAKIHEVVAIETTETAMLNWVALYGPIDVTIDSTDLSAYHGGIITNATSVELDHAVVVVGYGNTTDTPYWIVRNSWGAAWGEDGYFRVIRGLNMLLIQNSSHAILVQE